MSAKTENHFPDLCTVHLAESRRTVLTRELYLGLEVSAARAKVSLVEACLHEKVEEMARASGPFLYCNGNIQIFLQRYLFPQVGSGPSETVQY